jgi:hypothetical protein
MNPEAARKLLGGYASGTLTPEERQALFEAALRDQALFDELMAEQALKEALKSSAARGELLRAVEEAEGDRTAARPRRRWWVFGLAGATAAAAAAVTVLVIVSTNWERFEPQPMARVTLPVAPDMATPAPAGQRPARVMSEKRESRRAEPRERRIVLPPVAPETASPDVPPPALAASQPPPGDAARPAIEGRVTVPLRAPGMAGAGASAEVRARAGAENSYGAMAAPAMPKATAAFFATDSFVLHYSVHGASGGRGGAAGFAPAAAPEISVETNAPSYVYAFRREAPAGDWIALNPGGMSLAAGLRSTLAVPAGARNVLLIASRRPIPELAATGAQLTAAVERVRASVDASRISKTASPESATLTESGAGDDARIVVEIPLTKGR